MRKRNMVPLSCTVLVAGMWLAAGGAGAAESCQAGAYTVSTNGPTVDGSNTKITYTVSGNNAPDHVAAVVSSGSTNCTSASITSVTGPQPSGNQAYPPAVGDPITGLGKMSCHDEAVKINPNGNVFNFTITVSGTRAAQPKTVVVKKGNTVRGCEIVGIGDPGTPEVVAPVTEIIKEPGSNCAVEFTKDKFTGKVLHAQLTPESAGTCQLHQLSVGELKLELDSTEVCTTAPCSLGNVQFGEGYMHSGTNSCTTRIIGGRVYSWGDPCPE